MAKAYIVKVQQCSPTRCNELKADKTFPAVHSSQDPIVLFKLIQGLCCFYDSKVQRVMATVPSHKCLSPTTNTMGGITTPIHHKFMSYVETINTYGGVGAVGVISMFLDEKIREFATAGQIIVPLNPTDAEHAMAVNLVCEEYLCPHAKWNELRSYKPSSY
jgi:hypothetical protein